MEVVGLPYLGRADLVGDIGAIIHQLLYTAPDAGIACVVMFPECLGERLAILVFLCPGFVEVVGIRAQKGGYLHHIVAPGGSVLLVVVDVCVVYAAVVRLWIVIAAAGGERQEHGSQHNHKFTFHAVVYVVLDFTYL